MLKFSTYYGNDIWLDPARVLYVTDGGCGSRGLSAIVHLDTGQVVTISGNAEDVQSRITGAKA